MYPYRYDEPEVQNEDLKLSTDQVEIQKHGSPPPKPAPNHQHGVTPGLHGKPLKGPPSHIPKRKPYLYAVDPGAIRGCMYNFTYVWTKHGRDFWLYPTYVGRQSVSGYRWSRFGWTYVGISLDSIQSFHCGL